MGKILPVEAVVGAAMLKNKGWLRGRICFENEVVYTDTPVKQCTINFFQCSIWKGNLKNLMISWNFQS